MRDTFMVDEQQLLSDLVKAISQWVDGDRGRSLSSLARRSQVAYSTVRRIAQNESTPHPYSALAISEIVMSVPERLEFLQKHFPTIGNLMQECYNNGIRPEPNEEVVYKFLIREPHNRIFNVAATKAGTTRETVQRLAGQIGIEALEEMLEAGALIEHDNGTIKYTHDNWVLGSVQSTLNQVKLSVDHFDKSLVGTEAASLMHSTGSISPEAIPEVKKLILKFIKDLHALKNDTNSEGSIPFFCNLMYSLYDKEEWKH